MAAMNWKLAESLSWMWRGYNKDPENAPRRNGVFRVDLVHELGHWVVAAQNWCRPDGLGLYGLEHGDDGTITVTRGGGVPYWSSLCCDLTKMVEVDVAGIVAERLYVDGTFQSQDPIKLMSHEDLHSDLNDARAHLAEQGVSLGDDALVSEKLSLAMDAAAEIIQRLLPMLSDRVVELEEIVRAGRLPKLEFEIGPEHVELLGDPEGLA